MATRPPGSGQGKSRKNGGGRPRGGGSTHNAEDSVKINDNGTVDLVVDGFKHHLARPSVGQFRMFSEQLTELGRNETEAKQAALDAEKPYDSAASGIDEQVFAYWRGIVNELDSADAALPDEDDDMPPWLAQGSLITEVFRAWKTVPWVGGSSPSEREQATQTEQARSLAPLVQTLVPLLQRQLFDPATATVPSNGPALPPSEPG